MAANGNFITGWFARWRVAWKRRELQRRARQLELDRKQVNGEIEAHKERVTTMESGILRLEEESRGEHGDRQQVVMHQLKERLNELSRLQSAHALLVRREHNIGLVLSAIDSLLHAFKPGMDREEINRYSGKTERLIDNTRALDVSVDMLEGQKVAPAEALNPGEMLDKAARARGEPGVGGARSAPAAARSGVTLTAENQATLNAIREAAAAAESSALTAEETEAPAAAPATTEPERPAPPVAPAPAPTQMQP